MSLIALELEQDQIHVAAARSASRRIQIQHLFTVAVEGSDQQVAETLRSALSKHGLSRSEAIVVISRGNSEIRLVDVPPAPDNELPEIVRFISKNEFASLNENWLLDFTRLTGDQSTTGQVLAAGVSAEMTQQIKGIVDSAGLKLKHMVLRPFATVSVVADRLNDSRVRMLIDPNGDQTDMSILIGQKLVATRTVLIPSSTDDQADRILGEIKRTIASSSRALGGESISQFLVFGDAGDDERIYERLKSRLDVDVAFVDPLKLPMVGGRVSAEHHGTRYVSLMGALVQQASGERHPIDFLNPRRVTKPTSDKTKWIVYASLAATLLVMAVGFGWWKLNQQTSTIERLTQELEQLEKRNNGDLGVGVDQKLAEVGKIDEWILNRVDWQQELLEYSDLALTADDNMVDSLTASAPSKRTDGLMTVSLRSVDYNTEGRLVESLEQRYEVTPTQSSDAEEDKDYPIKSIFKIPVKNGGTDVLSEINKESEDYFKAQAAKRQAAAAAKTAAGDKESEPTETIGKTSADAEDGSLEQGKTETEPDENKKPDEPKPDDDA